MREFNKVLVMCGAIGTAFVIVGLVEALTEWFSFERMDLLTTGDLMLGLVLVLAGAVILAGAREEMHGCGGEAYMVVGPAIGLFAGMVAMLTMGANGAEHLLGNEDLVAWAALDDFTLAIVMMIPSALLLRRGLRAFRSVPRAEAGV